MLHIGILCSSSNVNTFYWSFISDAGNVPAFPVFQLVETISAEKWYQFVSAGQEYLVLASSASDGESTLYAWRGALLPVQVLIVFGLRPWSYKLIVE